MYSDVTIWVLWISKKWLSALAVMIMLFDSLSPIYCFQRKKRKREWDSASSGKDLVKNGVCMASPHSLKTLFFFVQINIRLPHILIPEFRSPVPIEPKMWNFTVETECWWFELLIIDFIHFYNIFFNSTLKEVRSNVQFFLVDESLVELSNHTIKNNSLAICFFFSIQDDQE